jgi:UDP-N-acetylmuramate--alanine ligase
MHNVWNAVTSAAACVAVGIPGNEIAEGLRAYRGVERRFQIRGTARGVTVVDDYAHHPTEIRATLEAARHGGYERIVAVFQPHRYSRTRALATEFGAAFSDADLALVMDVYPAGEAPIPGVSGRLVADAAAEGTDVRYFPHRDELMTFLMSSTKPGDVLLTLGAGDVTTVGEEFLERSEGP